MRPAAQSGVWWKPTVVAQLWWMRLPTMVTRWSPMLSRALTDGTHWAAASPVFGAAAPPAALVAGLVIGAQRIGFQSVITESLGLLLILAGLGMVSAHLGMAFLTGFAFGDFFLSRADWLPPTGLLYPEYVLEYLAVTKLPLLIMYGALGILLVKTPLLTRALVSGVKIPSRWEKWPTIVITMVLGMAVSFALAFSWALAVPLLIRPLFLWRGGTIPVEAMWALQHSPWLIGLVAGLSMLVSTGVQFVLEHRRIATKPATPTAETIEHAHQKPPYLPPVLQVLLQASWFTFLLAGLLATWIDGLALFLLLAVLGLARAGPLPLPLDTWRRLIGRIPLLVRLAVGLVIAAVTVRLLVRAGITAWTPLLAAGTPGITAAYRIMLVLIAVSLLIIFLADPGPPRARHAAATSGQEAA